MVRRKELLVFVLLIAILLSGCAVLRKTSEPEMPDQTGSEMETTPETEQETGELGAEAEAEAVGEEAAEEGAAAEETEFETIGTEGEAAAADEELGEEPDQQTLDEKTARELEELFRELTKEDEMMEEAEEEGEEAEEMAGEDAASDEDADETPAAAGVAAGTETVAAADAEAEEEEDKGIIINFENATVLEVLKAISDIIGIDYILAPGVAGGEVTIKSAKPIKKVDLFYVLQSILELNNLVAIDVGPYYKIVPSPEGKHRPIRTQIGKIASKITPTDEMITQIIPLDYITPDEIINTLRPLIADDAVLISHPGTNLLIMTGLASNIQRILKLVQMLDVETAVLELEIFQIQYADVNDIVTILERIFESQRTGTASLARAPRGRATRRRTTGGVTRGGEKDVLLIPDLRSNSIIVFAQKKDLEFIREIITMLDVDIYVSQKTYIYYMENARATDMAQLLGSVFSGTGREQRTAPRPRTRTSRTRQPGGTASLGAIGEGAVEGEVNIIADERTNALVIVTSPVNYPNILTIIKALDIMPKQVLIEVLIVDVKLEDNTQFGVEWLLKSQGHLDVGGDTYYYDGTAQQNLGIGDNTLGFTYNVFEASRFKSFLRAYARDSKLEVLSNPHILVANNMEAAIDVGNEVPIVTAEQTYDTDYTADQPRRTFNRTIQYRTTGILLQVVPHINEERYVSLELSQEVSNISNITVAGIDSPVIDKRTANTSVVVKDGQTLVIGGMMERKVNPSREGIPFLSRIPILGSIFGTRSKTESTSELLIFLTPHVVASPEEARLLSEELQDKTKSKLFDVSPLSYY